MVLLLISHISFAQDGRYVIFFSDKAGSTYSIDNPLEFLSSKSIERRTRNGVSIAEEDFPVNNNYISQVKVLGAEILHSSRWMNALVVQLEGNELNDIRALPFVSSTEYVSPTKPSTGGRKKRINQKKESNLGVVNQLQITMLGLDDMHNDNLFGDGVLVGVFDSGFTGVNVTDPFKHLFQNGQVTYTLDLVGNSGNVFQYDDHGTEVLSIMAANQMSYRGGAPNANYQLFVTEDAGSEFRIEEYNWLIAAEKADSAGVDIINSSLGYNLFDDATMDYTTSQLDGKTAVVSKAASIAISKGILVIVSAGNDGNSPWGLVNPPADVNGIISVGAITSAGTLSGFSSIGPTADGRIKPEVVALGSGVSVIKANGGTGFASGTSSASPLVASLAIGLFQAFPNLTAQQLYELIINSGNMSESPDNQKGYGVPNYLKAKMIQNGVEPTEPTSEIVLYPNPATEDVLKIAMDVPLGQEATVLIYNLHGQLLYKSEGAVTYANNPLELDVSGFASGLYIVKVETEGVLKTIRLVIL